LEDELFREADLEAVFGFNLAIGFAAGRVWFPTQKRAGEYVCMVSGRQAAKREFRASQRIVPDMRLGHSVQVRVAAKPRAFFVVNQKPRLDY
jgi:hypothetical protein